jgi:antitoxin ParD1/3/4
MATVRKTVTFTRQQEAWIKAQVNSGKFTNDSEYLRDLVRRDQERINTFQQMKSAIQSGLESGISNESLDDIWSRAEKDHELNNGQI